MRVGCSGVTRKRGWRRQSRRIIITTYYIFAYSRDRVASLTTTAVIYYYHIMTTDALLFVRVIARIANYIIDTTKCATAACCSTRAPDADDLSSCVVYWHLAFDRSAGTPVSWEFKTCHSEVYKSFDKWHEVAFMWHSGGNRWHEVVTGGMRWHSCGSADRIRYAPSVVVYLTINPDRAST
jgi:hypothetical protein